MAIRPFVRSLFGASRGLTLLELLLFLAIFTVLAVVFTGILVSVTNVYVKESGAATVSRQGDFLFRTIQRYIEDSSALHDDMGNSVSTNTLKLYTKTYPELVEIYAENGVVKIRRTDTNTLFSGTVSSTTEDLTDVRAVTVSSTDLVFTRYPNADGHDFVSFKFTMSHKSTNPLRAFSQTLQGGVARVSAATFDSNLLPDNNTRKIGDVGSNRVWQSLNDLIYFQGGNVGIGAGATNPANRLVVDGPVQLLNPAVSSACDFPLRGAIRVLWGSADQFQVCLANTASSTYSWITIATAP